MLKNGFWRSILLFSSCFILFFYRKMVYFALYIELETSNKDSNELKNIEFLFKLYNNGTWFFLEG
jgi:hypothetical protein